MAVAEGSTSSLMGIVFADGVMTDRRVKLKTEPREGVGTVNADAEEERVLEAGSVKEEGEDQLWTVGEKDPGVAVGEGNADEVVLACELVGNFPSLSLPCDDLGKDPAPEHRCPGTGDGSWSLSLLFGFPSFASSASEMSVIKGSASRGS